MPKTKAKLTFCQFPFNPKKKISHQPSSIKLLNFQTTQLSFCVPCWCPINSGKAKTWANSSWSFPSTPKISFSSLRTSKLCLKNCVKGQSFSWPNKKNNLIQTVKIAPSLAPAFNKLKSTTSWKSSASSKSSAQWSRNSNNLLTDTTSTDTISSWTNSVTSSSPNHCMPSAKQLPQSFRQQAKEINSLKTFLKSLKSFLSSLVSTLSLKARMAKRTRMLLKKSKPIKLPHLEKSTKNTTQQPTKIKTKTHLKSS